MRNDGGPAFPRDEVVYGHNGMTLRDYFAAKAMAALIAHHGMYDEAQSLADMTSATAHFYHSEAIASSAYAYADDMLKARGS